MVLIFIPGIVIKTGMRIGPIKKPGLGFHESSWINLEKLKNIFKVLIFHMKKILKKSM
jgi:hypothetical protein